MYYIIKKFFYYPGTCYAPQSGPIENEQVWELKNGQYFPEILTFESIEDAKNYLESMGIDDQITKQTFESSGRYVLAHGEYARPKYKIRKKSKS